MSVNWSREAIRDHLKRFGVPRYNRAHIVTKDELDGFGVVIPFVKNENVLALQYVYFSADNEVLNTHLIPRDFIYVDDSELVAKFSHSTIIGWMLDFVNHQYLFNGLHEENLIRLRDFYQSNPRLRDFHYDCLEFAVLDYQPGSGYTQYLWDACGWYGSADSDDFEIPVWNLGGGGGGGISGGGNYSLNDNGIELDDQDNLCSEQISPHLREYINEELFIEFHCSNESKNEIINNLIAVLCQDYAKVTFEEFEQSLKAFSHTIYNSLVQDCPCIFEFAKKIAQQGEDNFLCQVLESVNNSPNYKQKFKVYDNYDANAPLGQQAQQFYNVIQTNNSSQWTGTMYIPKSSCIGEHPIFSDEETMLIFMHEMMHGYYRQMILDNNFDYPNEPSNFIIANDEGKLVLNSQYWEFIIKSYWDIDPVSENDHVVFFQAYKSFIMNSLWEMNLQSGNPSDYEYYADVMINSKDLSSSEWSVLLGLNNYETEILPNLISKKETIDFSISNCN